MDNVALFDENKLGFEAVEAAKSHQQDTYVQEAYTDFETLLVACAHVNAPITKQGTLTIKTEKLEAEQDGLADCIWYFKASPVKSDWASGAVVQVV